MYGLLIEMSLPQNIYKDRINSILPQVFINWCLIRYCSISGQEQLKKHWKDELRGHLYSLSRLSIKKNDSETTRKKVFLEVLRENDFDDPQFMTLTICNKFIEEKINIHSTEFEDAVLNCIKSIEDIFNLILSRNIDEINNYVEMI